MGTTLAPTNPPSSSNNEVGFSLSDLSRIQHAILNIIFSSTFHLTQQDIAAELQLSTGTVSQAMRDEKFKRAYEGLCNSYSHARYKEVLDKITDLAIEGSSEHMKLYLKVHKILHDKAHDAPLATTDTGDYEQLQKRKAEIEKTLKEKYNIADAEGVEVSEDEK